MLRIFSKSLITRTLYTRIFYLFLPCGTLFRVLSAQVTWQHKEHSMRALNINHRSSLIEGGTWCNPIRK